MEIIRGAYSQTQVKQFKTTRNEHYDKAQDVYRRTANMFGWQRFRTAIFNLIYHHKNPEDFMLVAKEARELNPKDAYKYLLAMFRKK